MLWLLLALMTAFAVATHDAWVKRHFSHLTAFEMSAVPLAYALPLLAAALAAAPVPPLGPDFGWAFALSVPLNGVSFLLYMVAIKRSALSLTLPYLAFTPTFMILTGFVFLGEVPNAWGAAGILTTCIGSYVLNLETGQHSFWDPFKAVTRESGSWIMLCVAVIFSVAAVVGKKAIVNSSPLFFSLAFFTVHNAVLLLCLWFLNKLRPNVLLKQPIRAAAAGALFFAHILFHGYAITLTKAAYMISVKRLSVLIGIVYGGIFFHEQNLIPRLGGAVLMLSGALLIIVWGA